MDHPKGRPPRLFRPQLLFGAVAIILAVLSWLTFPAWRTSVPAFIFLVLIIVLGSIAIVRDMRSLLHEVRNMANADKRSGPPPDK